MLEQQIQKKIIDKLESKGYFVVKTVKTNKNGVPDLIACKDTQCIWIEVKRPGGKLSKLQEYRISEMKRKGLQVMVCYGVDEIENI